ncbi:MAG: hypothetical protein NTV05_05745 [Acidobacteria bacterium]|nr:hypothetical protein [Acidobacteriota bacterium]
MRRLLVASIVAASLAWLKQLSKGLIGSSAPLFEAFRAAVVQACSGMRCARS